MATPNTVSYKLIQDEPWMFLDARKNPVNGRKLTYQLADGTYLELDLTVNDYHNPATVKAKLQAEIDAHLAITQV
jgi:hypothetical protein